MEAHLGRAYALADPMSDLVADDDRRENIATAGTLALAHRDGGGGRDRAKMGGRCEVRVVGGGRIAHDRIRARGVA